MFRDTSVTDRDPTLPAPAHRRPWIREGVCEPEPLVVICFVCRSQRDPRGAWRPQSLERLFAADVTHALCPACLERLYPEPAPEPALVQ